MVAKGKQVLKELETGIEAELNITVLSLAAGGRRTIVRESLEAGKPIHRTIENLIAGLSGGHVESIKLFSELESRYTKVLALRNPNSARQARLKVEELEILWHQQRSKLEHYLAEQAQKLHGLGVVDANAQARRQIEKLNEHFDSRYGFITFTSQMPFENPQEFERQMRAKLSKSKTSASSLEELSQVANMMPFLQKPPSSPAGKLPDRGQRLFKELRQLGAATEETGKRVKAAKISKKTKAPLHSAPSTETQLQALAKLEHHCPEGDILYEDTIDIIDEEVAAYQAQGGSPSLTENKLINDIVNKVQGRTGEVLALKHPRFLEDVWKPANRTAATLCDELNAVLKKTGIPEAHHWRVEIITEPAFATTKAGKAGELLDSGIWLIREGPDRNLAMPIFGLEVKSGELRGAMQQQVLDWERVKAGFLDLPSSGRRYTITLPPSIEFQKALATTRTITDKRLLGKTKDIGPVAERSLSTGESLYTFRLPMRRSEIRASAYAIVQVRLEQLAKGLK